MLLFDLFFRQDHVAPCYSQTALSLAKRCASRVKVHWLSIKTCGSEGGLTAPARRPARVALQAGPVANHGELAAFRAGIAFVALEAGDADLLGRRGLSGRRDAHRFVSSDLSLAPRP